MMLKKNLFRILVVGGVFIIALLLFGLIKKQYNNYQHRQYIANLKDTASPNVHVLPDTILIDYLGTKRTLRIYLPPKYETDTISYPVIYFLDGGSLYNEKVLEGHEWQVDEVIDSVVGVGGPGAIVIGIENSKDRMTEYKPFLSPHLPEEKIITGDKHAEWIANDLKAWVDQNFKTKAEAKFTTVGGASLGGLMSYYMLTSYPNVFGNAIVFSPSAWVNEKVFELHKGITDFNAHKIYINVGENEGGNMVPDAERIFSILKTNGMPESNVRFDIVQNEGHRHPTWRKGFAKVYPWIIM